MKKLICSALALTMTSAAGFASDSEWSALDQEVGALASTLSLDGGASLSGRVSSFYADQDPATGGFTVNDARLAASGSHGDYGYRVEVDFADEGLRDAYATFGIGDAVSAQLGMFRASVSNDADLDEGSMKHLMHSAVGGAFTGFQGGLGLSGSMSKLAWAISLMNGGDGTADEILSALRVTMDLMDGGDGGVGVSASVAIVDDGATASTGATVIELNASTDAWSVGVETADVDTGGSGSLGVGVDATMLAGDTTPLVINGSYNVADGWEVAVRFTDMDDAAGNEVLELTANHYLDGHGLKWQVGLVSWDNDAGTAAEDLIAFGLHVAF